MLDLKKIPVLHSAISRPTLTSEHIGDLKKWVTELARQGKEGDTVRLDRAVDLISKNFGVQTHEVAILGLTSDERSLRFLAPASLRTIGQVPLSSGNALAARTLREKRPELINHFSVVPHASVFEGVPVDEEHPHSSHPKNHELADYAGASRDWRPPGFAEG